MCWCWWEILMPTQPQEHFSLCGVILMRSTIPSPLEAWTISLRTLLVSGFSVFFSPRIPEEENCYWHVLTFHHPWRWKLVLIWHFADILLINFSQSAVNLAGWQERCLAGRGDRLRRQRPPSDLGHHQRGRRGIFPRKKGEVLVPLDELKMPILSHFSEWLSHWVVHQRCGNLMKWEVVLCFGKKRIWYIYIYDIYIIYI